MIQAIIFTMDRAMQCESLLRSMDDMCTGIDRISVIVRATSQLHEDAYINLMNEERRRIPAVTTEFLVEEGGSGLATMLNAVARFVVQEGSHICINVDDQIYYRPADFRYAVGVMSGADAFVWSWRLGSPTPVHMPSGFWFCENSPERDHGYLWHSDGALYRRDDYLRVLDGVAAEARLEWQKQNWTPNHVETVGVLNSHLWRNRRHVGPNKPCCMTWQVNKESTTKGRFGAPWKTVPGTELDVLAQAFLDGKRVQNQILYDDHSWAHRFQQPDGIPTHVRACEEASRYYASLIR